MHTAQLLPQFDPAQLLSDYRAIRDAIESLPAGYPGEGHVGWRSICIHALSSGPAAVLERAPYLRTVLAELDLNLRLARLLALEPGGVIRAHSDAFLSERIVRLHLPIVTNAAAHLRIGGEICRWNAGELWYGDFSQQHEGANDGDTTRVHLVLDVIADARLAALFPPERLPQGLLALCANDAADELAPGQLDRFAFDFVLPAGFSLPGTQLERLEQDVQGHVGVVDSELCVFVNEQPLLKAVPLAEDVLALLGLGAEAQLRYAFDEQGASSVSLALGPHIVHAFDLVARRREAAAGSVTRPAA